jgi:hypothetical protein
MNFTQSTALRELQKQNQKGKIKPKDLLYITHYTRILLGLLKLMFSVSTTHELDHPKGNKTKDEVRTTTLAFRMLTTDIILKHQEVRS